MTLLEEVRKMQQQGTSDEQVIQLLREKGTSYRDIADALAQTKIKAAVEEPNTIPTSQFQQDGMEGMEPSIMTQPEQPQENIPQPTDYYPQVPTPGYKESQSQEPAKYQQDQAYNAYAQPVSADMISEISEQIVVEKLSELRKHLEKVIDLKSTFESRIEYLDDRLKRLEKTIDTLQSSVLRKVGDYVTNIQDIKTELIETQKTFAKLVPEMKKHEQKEQPKHPQAKK